MDDTQASGACCCAADPLVDLTNYGRLGGRHQCARPIAAPSAAASLGRPSGTAITFGPLSMAARWAAAELLTRLGRTYSGRPELMQRRDRHTIIYLRSNTPAEEIGCVLFPDVAVFASRCARIENLDDYLRCAEWHTVDFEFP